MLSLTLTYIYLASTAWVVEMNSITWNNLKYFLFIGLFTASTRILLKTRVSLASISIRVGR